MYDYENEKIEVFEQKIWRKGEKTDKIYLLNLKLKPFKKQFMNWVLVLVFRKSKNYKHDPLYKEYFLSPNIVSHL